MRKKTLMQVRRTRILKLPQWEFAGGEVVEVEEEVEGMEASLLGEARTNPEEREVQVAGVGVLAVVRVEVGVEEQLLAAGGERLSLLSWVRRKKESAPRALVSRRLWAVSGAFCHVGSQAGEAGGLGEDKMVV